jgi:L-fuconolactonase
MIVDAHQHVWDLNRAEYPWLTERLGPINRTVEFEELRPQLRRAGIGATILVQSADNREDTDYMLDVAAAHDEVVAVVAYVPLDRPAEAAEQLDRLKGSAHVVGVRNLIHEQPDPDWVLRPEVDEGLGLLEEAGMTFDLVSVLPRHLEHVSALGERHPGLRIVIDHLSKPPIGQADTEPWWSLIERASQNPLVHAKVSGLYPSSGPMADWSTEKIRPFFDRALEVFGSERLMYGGDWPISVLAGGYDRVWNGLAPLLEGLTETERSAITRGTATSFYRVDDALLRRAEGRSHDSPLDGPASSLG